jgi:hypothetical protein
MLIIIVAPALKPPSRRRSGEGEFDAGRFMASLDGRVLVQSSRQPLLDAARVLVGEGHDPGAVVTMRHAGSTTDALRARLGVAARLTVAEAATRFAGWKPHPGWSGEISLAGASIMGLDGVEGTSRAHERCCPAR